MTGAEKTAIFLSLIGEEASGEILRNLDIEDVGTITKHMNRLKAVRKEEIEKVIREMTQTIGRQDPVYVDGERFIRNALSKGLGEANARKALELAERSAPLESLQHTDPWILANCLMTEHPQTIAFVCCLLDPAHASELLAALDENLRVDVAMRIAKTERIPESAAADIREALSGLMTVQGGGERKVGGTKVMADILNRSGKTMEEELLKKIGESNPEFAESIQSLMFVFDDLVRLDDRSMQAILKEIQTEELALALKTAPEELSAKVFRNMSQRAAEILREEMETKGPVRVSDVEAAQRKIVTAAKALEKEGKIVIAGRGGDDVLA